MSYHLRDIPKGQLGAVSKIKEEFEEFLDSVEQDCVIMQLVELSDLLGAIEAYLKQYSVSLDDLLKMKDITKRAFGSGYR